MLQRNEVEENRFVVELLTTLRQEQYHPRAWQRFLWRSWNMSCETANNHLLLKHSWMRVTAFMFLLTLVISSITFAVEGIGVGMRLLPGFICCIAWQQADLFWHLGLNHSGNDRQLRQHIGVANILTGLRGLVTSYLFARLIAGLHTTNTLLLSCFLVGVATDIFDGYVARATHTQSKLGQMLDGEADFCLYTMTTIILIQNALLPVWLGIVMIVRFLLPLLGACVSYFVFAHPLRFGSTSWGKFAGLAQCVYFLVLLAPASLTQLTHVLATPLLMVTLILLVIAPVAQVMKNMRR